jgi:nucleoside-diphosphate-sugar epimerase
MKILITGSTGMVGKNILNSINFANFEILAPNRKTLDLLDYYKTEEYIRTNMPDLIIHAAGKVGGIQANIKDPVGYMIENIDMGRNIIMAAKNNNIYNLINIASSCMYPKNFTEPLLESHILKGELEPTNEGYALAKIMSTRLCQYISDADELFNYKTVIPCNLYGKYDKFDPANSHMLPAIIKKIHEAKLKNEKEVVIWGDGEARREFMYAEDLADFLFFAINNFHKMPDIINVGLGFDYTINEYYRIVTKLIGYEGRFVHDLSKPVGMKRKIVDITKLNNFNWKHSTTIEKGIEETYKYYLKNE